MATPNSQISSIGLSDVNVELSFPANTLRAFNDQIFRNLAGVKSKTVDKSEISLRDVSGKAAFDGVIYPSSNVMADFGTLNPSSRLDIVSDMYNPDITWTYNIVSGWQDVTLTFLDSNKKSANLRLHTNQIGVAQANVEVTASLSYGGHFIGSQTMYVDLQGTIYDPALVVSGNTNVISQGYVAQTAFTSLEATSNVANGEIRFTVDPGQGASISGNRITFVASTNVPGNDNTQTYSLKTEVVYKGNVVATDTRTVVVRATYLQADFTYTAESSANNQFANTGPVTSSVLLSANHNIAGANLSWSAVKVSGDTATFSVANNLASANLSLSTGTYGALKSIYDVTATLQYSNGYVLNQKTKRITLRSVAYGLNFSPASDTQSQGFAAQTAVATATASWQAGDFTWAYQKSSGDDLTFTPAISPTSKNASLRMVLNAPNFGDQKSASYLIGGKITFDGVDVTSTNSLTNIQAIYSPYSFVVSGPSVNTQIGAAPVTSTIQLDTSSNIAGYSVSFHVDNLAISNTTNASSIVLSHTDSVANAQYANVTIQLYDQYGRFVTQSIRNVALRVYDPKLTFSGSNNVSVSGYAGSQIATAAISATVAPGSNGFYLTPVKVSGNDLQIVNYTGNTVQDRVDISVTANAGTVGTLSGTYRINGTVTYFDKTYVASEDITVTATLINPNYTLTGISENNSSNIPPVSANVGVSSAFTVPGGYINWTYALNSGAVNSVVKSDNSGYVLSINRTAAGSTNTSVTITGNLYDSNNEFIASLSRTVNSSATVALPNLLLSGLTTSNVSNVYSATASVTLNASSDPLGVTYQFSTTKVSGSTASISTGASSISLSLTTQGSGTQSSVYDVTCTVYYGSTPLQSVTRRVYLTATAVLPTVNLSYSNSIIGSYNYPVVANTIVTASSSEAGYVTWSSSLVGGSALSVVSNTSVLSAAATASAIGAIDGTYDVTANFYSPGGIYLTSRTVRIRTRAERYDPQFQLNYVNGTTVSQYGWEENITAQGNMLASTVVPGTVSYVFSATKVSGANATFASSGAGASLTLTNSRTLDGVNAKSAVYDITCTLRYNNQTIGGPVTRRLTVQTVPYYLNITALPSSSVTVSDDIAAINVVASTNHPGFSTTPMTWTYTQTTTSSRLPLISTSSVNGGSNNSLNFSLTPPPYIGLTQVSYSVAANFYANGATRTSAPLGITLSAYSTTASISCVEAFMYLTKRKQAVDMLVDKSGLMDVWTPEEGHSKEEVRVVGKCVSEPCVSIYTESGAELICSATTPFNLRGATSDLQEGMWKYAADMFDEYVLVDDNGDVRWEKVVSVKSVGIRMVVPMDFGGKSFAAGTQPNKRIYSHNMAKIQTYLL